MKRRSFLAGMLAVPAVSYFDMGRSWQRHDELWLPDEEILVARRGGKTGPYEAFLKEYYDSRAVYSLTYQNRPLLRFR